MMKIKTSARLLLLTGGLVHLFPHHLTPAVQMGWKVFTLQRIIGGLSVILALALLIRQRELR